MSSLGTHNWTFRTKQFRVEYRDYGRGLRFAMVYWKGFADCGIPIGSASTLLLRNPNLPKHDLLRIALSKATEKLTRMKLAAISERHEYKETLQ